ncbi:MAG: hypothetical protein ACYCZF_15430 [Anaerolineae bacterium]
MKLPVRLGITAVCNPLEVGAADAMELLRRVQGTLTSAGDASLVLVSTTPVNDPTSAVEAGRYFYDQRVDAICVLAATWYEDYLVLDMLEECQAPVIAWGRSGMETGSLCGVQQVCFMLKQLGHPYLFLFDKVDSLCAAQQTLRYARAVALSHHLHRARIGYLGHRVEGMTETTVHELALKRLLGPRVVGLDSQVFLDRAAGVPVSAVQEDWKRTKQAVGPVCSSEASGLESIQVYQALRETIAESGLSAVAVGCYPHLMGKVCLAASLLAEEGIPIACEGDINGAVGMLILTLLSGQAVHNTDLLDPIPADNAVVFAHCGSGGFSLASDPSHISLAPVRLMNRGVCCLFAARPGPVTLLNITPTVSGYRLAALFGEALETEMVFPGNPLKVQFRTPCGDILNWIAQQGLGHHWMAAYGDLREELGHLAALTGCEWLSKE